MRTSGSSGYLVLKCDPLLTIPNRAHHLMVYESIIMAARSRFARHARRAASSARRIFAYSDAK